MTIEDAARDLYGLDPTDFVAARTELVAAAKKAGDGDLAEAIGRLRKPTISAWTVNLLARSAPEEVDALLGLGAALRKAQRELSGERLRALGTQRQQIVNAVAERARALAAERGRPVGEAVLRDVGRTLTAALADDDVASRISAGTLATAADYEGFGPLGPALAAVPDRPPAEKRAAKAADPAREELEQALAELETARGATDSAREEAESTAERLAVAQDRLERARAELAHAEQQRQFARTAERDARERLRTAERHADRAERRVGRAREQVDGD
ncbi:hypothetical protein OG225_37630 [Nocardia sp. NBC_01377]|uniref:hypothetical protein n=1 Tax=Nocardia sp. NBC_01377 TaxID=2903595 RepID=UPI00324D130D